MIKIIRRLAVVAAPVLAGIVLVATPALASSQLVDGGGTNLAVALNAHGSPSNTTVGAGTQFTKHAVGGDFQLQGPGGTLCLTVNEAQGNRVYSEGCAGQSQATLWFDAGGGIIKNVEMFNQGLTGDNLVANTAAACTTPGQALFGQGGVAAGDCHVRWNL